MPIRPFIALVTALLALTTLFFACSDDGDGISNYYFASANNSGLVELTLSTTTNLVISPAQPLAVAFYSNLNSDGTPGAVYRSFALTGTNSLVVRASNITVQPLYVVAWHDLNNNAALDKLEPFATYKGALTLTNLKPLKVYGGSALTNELAIGVTHYYLYRTATLRVALSYTGALAAQATNRLGVALFAGTNFALGPVMSETWLQTKSRTFVLAGITNAKVYLAGWFDTNGDEGHATGEPCIVYSSGNSTAAATAISLATNVTTETTVSQSFGDGFTGFH